MELHEIVGAVVQMGARVRCCWAMQLLGWDSGFGRHRLCAFISDTLALTFISKHVWVLHPVK